MKIRKGFVSNSSSSSFLCLGVEDSNLIKKLFAAEGFKRNKEGYYDGEGYGALSGKEIIFYGSSGGSEDDDNWMAAGLDEKETKEILENNTLKEARKIFKKLIKDRLGIDIPEKSIGLLYGEASSE